MRTLKGAHTCTCSCDFYCTIINLLSSRFELVCFNPCVDGLTLLFTSECRERLPKLAVDNRHIPMYQILISARETATEMCGQSRYWVSLYYRMLPCRTNTVI